MTFTIAFFADLGAGLTAYPTDGHMQQIFKDFLSQAQNKVQIAVQRDGNLLHYGYMRRVQGRKTFGICVSIPSVVCNISEWFNYCDDAFTSLVVKGSVVHLFSNGTLKIANNNLPDEKDQLELLKDALLERLRLDKTLKYAPLPAASMSVSNAIVSEHSLEEGDNAIRQSLEKYYKIFITKKMKKSHC